MSKKLPLLLVGWLCLGGAGCVFDTSGLGPPYWQCSTELWDCPVVTLAPSIALTGSSVYPQVASYKQLPDLWANPKQAYQVYWDQATFLFDLGQDQLKGSLLIMTGAKDSWVATPDFFRLQIQNDVRQLYVAYDSRANPKPSWLSQGYVKETDSNGMPFLLTITRPDQSKPPPRPFVTLEIWRRKLAPKKGETVVLPGNSHGKPQWPGVPAGNEAMYLVLIEPARRMDCKQGKRLPETASYDDCEYDQNAIAATALAECRKKNGPGLQCLNTVCSEILPYVKDSCPAHTLYGGALTMRPESYVPASEIGFSASRSSAIVEFKGKKYQRPISGSLHFEYQPDAYQALLLMRLDGMQLALDAFDSEIGRIENIAIALLLPCMAECTDPYPPWKSPCNAYRIQQGAFHCGESCTVKGKPIAFGSQNDRDLDIHIDHTARTMTVTGSTSGTARINDEDVALKIQLTLVGDFLNFAPTAAPSAETTREVECSGERTNRDPVVLDASSSFDVYEPLPATKATYEWYEDYRLLTEKSWGSGKTVTIAPHKLGLGVHSMSLVVLDKNGLADSDTFGIAVRDRIPPKLVVPADVHLLLPEGTGPVKVPLGSAAAFDVCSPEVSIGNDAPVDGRFEPGLTAVTWTAEDGSGNVSQGVQQVYYFTYQQKSFRNDLAKSLPFLEKAAAGHADALEECLDACLCEVELEPLAAAVGQVAAEAGRLTRFDQAGSTQLVERLEAAASALREADLLLERSNRSGEDSGALRREALTRVNTAQALLGLQNPELQGIP